MERLSDLLSIAVLSVGFLFICSLVMLSAQAIRRNHRKR